MPEAELLSLRDILRWAISEFNAADLSFGQGNDNAWDEAVYLLLHTLKLPLDTLEPFLDARLLLKERKRCIYIINERVKTRKPAAYITKEAWLQGLRFIVDERVIIPRSPIAELLNDAFEPWIEDPHQVNNVLDLCTGSACLAIMSAYVFPNAVVDAIDLDQDALAVAQQNLELHDMQERVNLIQSNLMTKVAADKRYDIIICNPPYVNALSMQNLPAEYKYEPEQALAGGSDGMDLIKTILKQSQQHLSDDGFLVLEIGHEYQNFINAFPDIDPIWLSTAKASDQIMLLHKSAIII